MSAARSEITVLVVDDDEDIRFAMSDTLEAEGYRVVLARDGLDLTQIEIHQRPPISSAWVAMARAAAIAATLASYARSAVVTVSISCVWFTPG